VVGFAEQLVCPQSTGAAGAVAGLRKGVQISCVAQKYAEVSDIKVQACFCVPKVVF
jgi:hypothetical protein